MPVDHAGLACGPSQWLMGSGTAGFGSRGREVSHTSRCPEPTLRAASHRLPDVNDAIAIFPADEFSSYCLCLTMGLNACSAVRDFSYWGNTYEVGRIVLTDHARIVGHVAAMICTILRRQIEPEGLATAHSYDVGNSDRTGDSREIFGKQRKTRKTVRSP